MSGSFSGLAAIVTGGSSGIGAVIARQLLDAGCAVAVLDRSPEASPEGALAFATDVADARSVQTSVEQAAEALGRLDIVINNAGIGAQGTVEANSDEEWLRVFDVNVVGIARVSRAALPWLRRSPAAAIVVGGARCGPRSRPVGGRPGGPQRRDGARRTFRAGRHRRGRVPRPARGAARLPAAAGLSHRARGGAGA